MSRSNRTGQAAAVARVDAGGTAADSGGTTYPGYEDPIGCGFTTNWFDLDQQADPALHVDQGVPRP